MQFERNASSNRTSRASGHTYSIRIGSKKNYGEVGLYLGDSAKMVEDVYGKLAKATEMLSEEIG